MVWEGWRDDVAFGLGAVPRARIQIALLLVLWICTGCRNGLPIGSPEPARLKPTSSGSPAPTGPVTIDSLRLSFSLPPSFQVFEDPGFVYLARSVSPPAVFSIAKETPSVTNHEPEAQEAVAPADIEGVEAVIVTDAEVEGLPAGVTARELLVANGDRSFSLIMSAAETDLAELWDRFIASVRVEAD